MKAETDGQCQTPEKITHRTFAITENGRDPGLLTSLRPNGHDAKNPMRNEARSKGIPRIVMHQRSPASIQPRYIQNPEHTNQVMLRIKRTTIVPSRPA